MKKKVETKKVISEKKSGLRATLMVHGVLIILGLLPFMNSLQDEAAAYENTVEINFVNADISSGTSSSAKKTETPKEEVIEKSIPKPKATEPVITEETSEVEIENNDKVIETEEIEEVIEEETQAEVVDESETEVVVEVVEEGEGEGDEGDHITGKELGEMDFEGDGIFGRKVIYRADVKSITEREGKVVVNLCVNREGLVTHVAWNKENSTITDTEYVKKAMEVAALYRFQKDYSAPSSQCGKLSFIFDLG